MKISKRYKEQIDEFIYHGEKTPLSTGTIAICFLCLLLIIVATFTQIEVSHLWPIKNAQGVSEWVEVHNNYIPQVPIIIFIAALLGPGFALSVVLMYLVMGFFIWPVFALGGGLEYVKSGLFGYILGYVFAVIPVGLLLQKKYNFKNMILATISGVLIIHLCGVLYCVVLGILKVVSFAYVASAIHSISGVKTFYDIIISFAMILFAIPAKRFLWIAMRHGVNIKHPKKFERNKTSD